jgi:hypothetical protein
MSKATAATTTALGILTPWSAPVRVLAARGLISARRRRAGSPDTAVSAAPSRRTRRRSSRLRTLAVAGAIGGVVAVGAAVAIRARTQAPPPVAPAPPRVQDVPTADSAEPVNPPE